MVGWSGLRRVEYWLRPDTGRTAARRRRPGLEDGRWQPCAIDPPPKTGAAVCPKDVMPREVWGFDPARASRRNGRCVTALSRGRPSEESQAGAYEFRVRSMDLNGFAQPEPRPYPKSGRNEIQYRPLVVMA